METKQKFVYVSSLKESFGYGKLFTVEPLGLSGGLAVFWKECYKVNVLSLSSRVIDLKVKLGLLSFFITCVYGDPVRALRNKVWKSLAQMGSTRDDPWFLIGDFDELRSNAEKLGGTVRSDSTCSGCIFSWGGWRDNLWIQCHL